MNTQDSGSSTTSIYRFTFPSGKKWFAFREMGRAASWLPTQTDGALFAKLLGTGNGSGFSSWPDFSTYMLIVSWATEAEKSLYHQSNAFLFYKSCCSGFTEIEVSPIQSHGSWHGVNPFAETLNIPTDKSAPVLVLTRARIRPSRLVSFWRRVPKVARQMTQSKGLVYAKGVGELPLVEQATLSLWENEAALNQAAYQRTAHSGAVRDTRKYDWYSEELFVRFQVLAIKGAPLV